MKNILNTNELLSLDSNLTPLKKRTLSYMVTFIIGIAVIFLGTHIESTEYVSYTIAIGGVIIAIIALGFLFVQPQEIVNQSSQEILHKHKLYFHCNDLNEVSHNLESGNINALFQKACDTGQILAIIYSTTNKRYYIAQLFKFIPYEYTPYQEPIIYNK